MKGINRIQWCSVVLLVFSLTACKVKRPETVLPDAKMENVLYDYHIAKAMGEEVPYNESYKRVLYIESVFKKMALLRPILTLLWSGLPVTRKYLPKSTRK